MPASFLLVLIFLLCSAASPLLALGLIYALCTNRWRKAARTTGRIGLLGAALFLASCLGLNAALGTGEPVGATTLVLAGGAGFTVGVLAACTYAWMLAREVRR